MSPLERVTLKKHEELADYERQYKLALKDDYAVIQVSARRYRIIKRTSFSTISFGVENVFHWEYASEPLDFEQYHEKLKELRGTKNATECK